MTRHLTDMPTPVSHIDGQQARLTAGYPDRERRARSLAAMTPDRRAKAKTAVAAIYDRALADEVDAERRARRNEIMQPAYRNQIGGVTVTIRMGHLDDMPRCKVCGLAVCHHSDAAFAGLVRAA